MIATAIFVFLLGTTAGPTSAVQSDVLYEPSRIAISEKIDQGPILVPELGAPPYVSNVVHQGSNYFFGMPFPPGKTPALVLPAEKIVTEVIENSDCKNLKSMCKSEVTDIEVRNSVPIFDNPVMEKLDAHNVFQNPKLSVPIPNISLNVQPIPYLPSVPMLNINSQLLSQLPPPLDSIKIPGLPLLKYFKVPEKSMLVESPYQTPDGFVISDVDVLVKKIPPPPKLPPLEIEDFLNPVVEEDRSIILVPAFPEIQEELPPSDIIAGRPCQPTMCAQDIIFDRVLPNILCEKSKTVELISMPATKRMPAVTAPFLPFMKK